MIVIAGNCNVVIYHRLGDSNTIIRPDLSANVIKLCGVSGETLWGWRRTVGLDHVRRIYLPRLGSDGHINPLWAARHGNFRRLLLASSRFVYPTTISAAIDRD